METQTHCDTQLVEARKLTTSREMLLWMTPSEAPKALQTSECSELLDPMRASCWEVKEEEKQLSVRHWQIT